MDTFSSFPHLLKQSPDDEIHKIIKSFLEEKWDPNLVDEEGDTVLHIIAKNSDLASCTVALLENGANSRITNNNGYTPLHIAATAGATATVYFLLSYDTNRSLMARSLYNATTKGAALLLLASLLQKQNNLSSVNVPCVSQCLNNKVHSEYCSQIKSVDKYYSNIPGKVNLDKTISNSFYFDKQDCLRHAITNNPLLVPILLSSCLGLQGQVNDPAFKVFMDLSLFETLPGCNEEISLLACIANSGNLNLLKHPVCEAFLHLKWLRIRFLPVANLLIFTSFITSLTGYLMNWTVWNIYNLSWAVPTATGAAIISLREAIQLLCLKTEYVKQIDNWATIFLLVSSYVLLFTQNGEAWQKSLSSVTLLVGWTQLTFTGGRFPAFGIYVQMFNCMMKRFLSFSAVFSALFIGFLVALYVDARDPPKFDAAAIKTLIMAIGSVDWQGITGQEDGLSGGFSRPIFIIFILAMPVVTMNLLLGLSIQDIGELQREAGVRRLALTTYEILSIEKIFGSKILLFLMTPRVHSWLRKKFSVLTQYPTRAVCSTNKDIVTFTSLLASDCFPGLCGTNSFDFCNIYCTPNDTINCGKVYTFPFCSSAKQSKKKSCQNIFFINRKKEDILPYWIIRNLRVLLSKSRHLQLQLLTSDQQGSQTINPPDLSSQEVQKIQKQAKLVELLLDDFQ